MHGTGALPGGSLPIFCFFSLFYFPHPVCLVSPVGFTRRLPPVARRKTQEQGGILLEADGKLLSPAPELSSN